jgi:hypothetical protein
MVEGCRRRSSLDEVSGDVSKLFCIATLPTPSKIPLPEANVQ